MTPFFLLLASLAAQSGAEDTGAELVALAQYRWQNRLIIIFAPSPDDPRYAEQQASWGRIEGAELSERDLLIFSCFTSGVLLEPHPRKPERLTFGPAEADMLRTALGVEATEFQVVLIGKDGSEKQRNSVPVAAESILAEIDSMPMRQQELRE